MFFFQHESVWQEVSSEGSHVKYTEQANRKSEKVVSRKKRESLIIANNNKNSCFMSLMSDKFLFDHFMERSNGVFIININSL